MIGAEASQNPLRGWLLVAARWIAALLVLGLLFHFLPWQQLVDSIKQVRTTRFFAILLGYLLAHLAGIAKWRMVVNAAGAKLDFATCAQCYTSGLFATLFLPSIIGGDLLRLAVGLRRSPNPAAVLAGNVADRFLDATAQAVLVLVGLMLLPGSVPLELETRVRNGVLVLAGIGVLLVIFLVLARKPLLRGRSVQFRRRLAKLRHALRSVSRRRYTLLFGWLLGVAIQSSFLFLTALLAISCGLFLPLRVWLFGWPLAKLAAILPLTQGGIGVREAALVALLAPFGAAPHLVLASGLMWEGVVIVGGLIAGLVAFMLSRQGNAKTAH
ncbi:MAG TPA: lysylphosphatidylglycerol synthase transmembrane domain-containing protein [Candidatus Acidoferrum sp.]